MARQTGSVPYTPIQAPISLSFPYTSGHIDSGEKPDWRYVILDPISPLHIPRMYFHEGSLYAFSDAGTAQHAVIRDYEGLREEPQGWMITGDKVKTPKFWNLFVEASLHPQELLDLAARQAMESLKDL